MTATVTGTTGGVLTLAEIASQPALWARAVGQATSVPPDPALGVLPRPGEPVVIVGAARRTTSATATRSCAPGRGHRPDASRDPGRDDGCGPRRDGPAAVALGHHRRRPRRRPPGRHHEPDGPPSSARRAARSNTAAAEHQLLDWADERSVVQTRFATTALTVLRASLGEDLCGTRGAGRLALAAPLPPPALTHLVFLGHA